MAQQIGLISDIHGEIDALWQALDILNGQGASQVLCSGDLVEKWVNGDQVVDLIQERGILCVLGNHDQKALGVSDKSRKFLCELPLSRRMTIGNTSLMLAHGTPTDNQEYLWSYVPPEKFQSAADDADSNVLIVGHTHEPLMVEHSTGWILNPGSVCSTQAWGSGTCAVLTVPGCHFRVFDIQTGNRTTCEYVDIT